MILEYKNTKREVDFLDSVFKKYVEVRKILDAGCDTGGITVSLSIPLSKKEYDIIGLNINKPMIEEGKKR